MWRGHSCPRKESHCSAKYRAGRIFVTDSWNRIPRELVSVAAFCADRNVRATQAIHTTSMLDHLYSYRRMLPHYQKSGSPVFITFCKLLREPFPPKARYLVLGCCVAGHDGRKFQLHAAVVMPDHVHLILTPLTERQRMAIQPSRDSEKSQRRIGTGCESIHGHRWSESGRKNRSIMY